MSASVTTKKIEEVMVLSISGRLILGESVSVLRQAVQDAIRSGHRKLLVNLAGTAYVDSSGLGELVSAFSVVSDIGGELKLVNVNKRVQDLLLVTKLYSVFDIHDDEAAALKSFSASTVA